MLDILRKCVFHPYTKGREHPVFSLVLYYVPGHMNTGQQRLGYRFRMNGKMLFQGEDYGCSPCNAWDSDEAVAVLMSFLCLKPGDTDREYFEKYTEEQMDFCTTHGEALWCCVNDRFGEDVCN